MTLPKQTAITGPRAPRRRLGPRLAARLFAGLAMVAVLAATATAADPSPTPPDTLDAAVQTATASGAVIGAPAYPATTDVYLVARACEPVERPLAAGDYYLAVFDNTGVLRSTDSLAGRRFTVDTFGRISGTTGTHASTRTICPGNGTAFLALAVAPFTTDDLAPTDTLWLRVASRTTVDACVTSGDATGFGCSGVERTSVAFAIDPAASPAPSPSPSPSPSASDSAAPSESTDPSASPSGSAIPSASDDPAASASPDGGSPLPSGSGAASPTASGSPAGGASPAPSSSASPVPSASVTPAPAANSTPRPTPSPAPRTPVPAPPRGGTNPATGPTYSPPAVPSYAPYSIPPGFYICPGQLITPTGCAPLESGAPAAGGATPTPSWTWGPVPSGAPVFPGTNVPGGTSTDPQPSASGATPGDVAGGSVEAEVDLFGVLIPEGVNGAPSTGASAGASRSPSTTPSASPSTSSPAPSGSTAGAVAGATGLSQDGGSLPPQPAPTASLETPAPPALPLVLALVLVTLVGAMAAAAVGWSRRRAVSPTVSPVAGEATSLDVPLQPVATGMARFPRLHRPMLTSQRANLADVARRLRRGPRGGAGLES